MSVATANAATAEAATREQNHYAELFAQARELDAQMEAMRLRYGGKVVVFRDGRVLCDADTEEEAIARIPDDQRGLPLVIRRIAVVPVRDFMGGPKGQ